MFTCRKELEDILGLKHPRKFLIEDSQEIPRVAERIFKGAYSEPDKFRRGLSDLQREITAIAELLGVRKNRLRDWQQELPGAPSEAEEYIKETSLEFKVRSERAAMIEGKILAFLQEQKQVEMFPIGEEILGKYHADKIVLFPRVIERVASLLKLPPDSLTKVVLVHLMTHVLLFAAEDRDQRVWARHELHDEGVETLVHYYGNLFYRIYKYKELAQVEGALVRILTASGRDTRELDCLSKEQVNSAMIFWRRRAELNLREVLEVLNDLC